MKLQRIDHWPVVSGDGQSAEWVAVESCDGECYRASDVDALLARIREAVEAEREAVFRHVVARGRDSGAAMQESLAAAAALDALLSGEG